MPTSTGPRTEGLAVAVSEALTNVVMHAYTDCSAPGDIELHAYRVPDDGLNITVCDDGRGVRPRADSPGLGLACR
ncbi:ATP-binding protein [Baekduia soli]|uniref:ATP-binding protein n=1 Tax=Baekduia soli TaxID=496014 RepID=A0A5B8U049_9ACTN|nr:ATP-binding protein [Baekduia soli]